MTITNSFLAESAPKSVRGSMTSMYNLLIILSLMLAFWINYGVSLWSTNSGNTQWRIAMGIQLIPGVLMCLMIPFVPESARYLINHGKSEKGLQSLCKLRKLPSEHPYLQLEYREMEAQMQYEQECYQGHSYWVVIKDIFLIKSNFRRFFLAVMLFLFHKFTGTDSLNVCISSYPFFCLFPYWLRSKAANTTVKLMISNIVLCTGNFCTHRCQRQQLYSLGYWCLWSRQACHNNLLRCLPGGSSW